MCCVVKFHHSRGARNDRPKADHSDPELQCFSGMYVWCAVLSSFSGMYVWCAVLSSSAIAEELGMSGPRQIILIRNFNVSLVCTCNDVCTLCRVVKFRHSRGARDVWSKADHSDQELQSFFGAYVQCFYDMCVGCIVLSSSAIAEELGMSGPKQIILFRNFNVSLVCMDASVYRLTFVFSC